MVINMADNNKGRRVLKEFLKKKDIMNRQFYDIRSLLGNSWAIFYFLLGGRGAGKSYAVTNFYVKQYAEKKRPFYWLRLSDSSAKKLLVNNAEKLIDPDLRRRYNLDLSTTGNNVYNVIERDPKTNKIKKKELMARVLSLATFYNDKGSGYYDKDFLDDPNMFYNICLDEMNREQSEKNTFDILYSFTNQIENLIRATKNRVRIICIGNTLEEASDLLCAFNFLPEDFGRFKLVRNKKILMKYLSERNEALKAKENKDKLLKEIDKKYANIDFGRRAIIEYIEPTESYKTMRRGTVADILMPNASTFTNEIKTDDSLVCKDRLVTPVKIIAFRKDIKFTVWNSNIISEYHNEKVNEIPMRAYLDLPFSVEMRDSIVTLFDTRCFKFRNLITFKKFQKELALLKPRK